MVSVFSVLLLHSYSAIKSSENLLMGLEEVARGKKILAIWFGYSVHFSILYPPTFLSQSRFSPISLRSFFVIVLILPITSKIH